MKQKLEVKIILTSLLSEHSSLLVKRCEIGTILLLLRVCL